MLRANTYPDALCIQILVLTYILFKFLDSFPTFICLHNTLKNLMLLVKKKKILLFLYANPSTQSQLRYYPRVLSDSLLPLEGFTCHLILVLSSF